MKPIMLINTKMSTTVGIINVEISTIIGILTFISMINTTAQHFSLKLEIIEISLSINLSMKKVL